LITPSRPAAASRLAPQLLVADEGERGAELFVFDNRGMRDLANFVEGPIRQVDPAVTDRQPTVSIIEHGHPLADRRLGLLAGLQKGEGITTPRARLSQREIVALRFEMPLIWRELPSAHPADPIRVAKVAIAAAVQRKERI
jgi:hypothetical protein